MLPCLAVASAFLQPQLPARAVVGCSRASVVASAAGESLGRRALLSAVGAGAGAVIAGGVGLAPAFAESTLVTRQQAYSRYVPRIERGRDYWEGGLRSAIASKNWGAVARELEKKGAVSRVIGPMELWASSWSGKTISDKSVAMNAAVEELREACQSLQLAATGQEKDNGMFGFVLGPKKLDESKRDQLAKLAYLKGASAINKYIEIGNDGMGLSFAPIETLDIRPI
jgi:hypothetical protein